VNGDATSPATLVDHCTTTAILAHETPATTAMVAHDRTTTTTTTTAAVAVRKCGSTGECDDQG
jgi:hypothetical protein